LQTSFNQKSAKDPVYINLVSIWERVCYSKGKNDNKSI